MYLWRSGCDATLRRITTCNVFTHILECVHYPRPSLVPFEQICVISPSSGLKNVVPVMVIGIPWLSSLWTRRERSLVSVF